jgi:hypothetical protein
MACQERICLIAEAKAEAFLFTNLNLYLNIPEDGIEELVNKWFLHKDLLIGLAGLKDRAVFYSIKFNVPLEDI